MAKPLQKKFDTCPMLARSDWGVSHIQSKGLTHSLSLIQSAVGFHGPRIAGWLVFLNGCHRGEDMRLPIGDSKVGSSWMNDCVLTGVGIGSQHATISMGSGEGYICPSSADRVVKIDNTVISGRQMLEDGCLVTIGEVHSIFRISDQKSRGFEPSPAPRPAQMPSQVMPIETVCGWLVIANGVCLGQDFRIIPGNFRIGSELKLEMTLPEAHLPKHALTLTVTTKDCKIGWIAPGVHVAVNRAPSGVGVFLKESDYIKFDHVEGYLKWFRS